jgi:hypothetical protein
MLPYLLSIFAVYNGTPFWAGFLAGAFSHPNFVSKYDTIYAVNLRSLHWFPCWHGFLAGAFGRPNFVSKNVTIYADNK